MTKIVPIRFNDDELARLEKAFGASEDEHLGTHIKRVYFDALKPNADLLGAVRREIEALRGAVDLSRRRGGGPDDDLALTLICGLYLLIHKSVPDSQRIAVDKIIDVKQVEQYLKGGK